VDLAVDFFPENDPASMDRDLQAVIRDQGTRMVSTLLEPWLPNRMIEGMLRGADVDPSTRGLALTREKRSAIVGLLKNWRIGRVASVPIERGEVTAGGVALNEVEPRTMHSRLVRGLYLCGEVLDVAGPVGGYNLQAAFSTGFVAGESAAMDSLSGRALHAGWY
jgi:predicted Rossmann fold flavoprotein